MADGKFEVRELSFNLSHAEFVVDCGFTGLVQACGQKTAKSFALRFDGAGMNLDGLKKALEDVLAGIEALKKQPQPMSEVRAAARLQERRTDRFEVRDLHIHLDDGRLVVRCGEASVVDDAGCGPHTAPYVEMAVPFGDKAQLRAQLEQALRDLKE